MTPLALRGPSVFLLGLFTALLPWISAPAEPSPKSAPSEAVGPAGSSLRIPARELPVEVIEQEILRLIDRARSQHGLAALQSHDKLREAALGHSQEMLELDYFDHESPMPGRTRFSDRLEAVGLRPMASAENLYTSSGFESEAVAQAAVAGWLNSPGHRRNILSARYTHTGIGVARERDTYKITQLFAGGLR